MRWHRTSRSGHTPSSSCTSWGVTPPTSPSAREDLPGWGDSAPSAEARPRARFTAFGRGRWEVNQSLPTAQWGAETCFWEGYLTSRLHPSSWPALLMSISHSLIHHLGLARVSKSSVGTKAGSRGFVGGRAGMQMPTLPVGAYTLFWLRVRYCPWRQQNLKASKLFKKEKLDVSGGSLTGFRDVGWKQPKTTGKGKYTNSPHIEHERN